MAFLTNRDIRRTYGPEAGEIRQWLADRKLKSTNVNRALASRRITASNIKKTLGKSVSVLESAGNWQVIYGEARVGGTITFAHTTENNSLLHLVITLACHEIDSVQKLYLDNQEVIFGDSPDIRWSTAIKDLQTGVTRSAVTKVFMAVNNGAIGNPAIADLVAQVPSKWTTDHKQEGRAHVYIILRWDAILFPDGLPEISFLVRGKKCYDPRSGVTQWTSNSALQVLDYLTSSTYGLGVPLAECETLGSKSGNFKSAADVCDQDVLLNPSGTEKRYTGNGFFEIGESHQANIESLCSAMAGSVTYSGGTWKCWPAIYRNPIITLSEGDILGSVRVATRVSRRDNFNAVKGTYVSPKANYEETDFPPIRNAFYRSEDNNEEIFEDIQLPFTTSSSTAQRIAKILLEQIRQPIIVEVTASLKALQVEAGETVSLTWSRFGWNAKAFEVEEIEPQFLGSDENLIVGVRLILRETAAGIYNWNNGEETTVDLSPNTDLPDPFTVLTPTGLTVTSGTSELFTRLDGTIFSRMRVSWTLSSDAFVSGGGYVEISYRLQGATDWSTATLSSGDGTFIHILDVKDGQVYQVRARAKSAFGVWSGYTAIVTHTILGKSQAPSNVTGLFGTVSKFGIFLTWNAITDLDLGAYEVRQGPTGSTWETSTVVAQTKSTSAQIDIKIAGTYRFLIKAIDTSNNYSTSAGFLDVTIDGPTSPTLSYSIVGPDAVLNWGESVGLFQVKEYEIRYGTTFSSATIETAITGNSYARRVNWSGARRYWVVARDVAGNLGTPTSIDIDIISQSAPTGILAEVVDNNVLLKYTAPSTGTLPIDRYEIRKGSVFSSAQIVGTAFATFAALFETTAGSYTYWVVAIDTAGNVGTAGSVTATVSGPPDYQILAEQLVDFSGGTGARFVVDGAKLYISPNSTDTFEQHFTSNSFTTIQSQIDAGYPYYIQPTRSSGYWTKVIDFGASISAGLIDVTWLAENIFGTSTISAIVGYSNDNVTFTESENTRVFASNFRYVRITLKNYAGLTPPGSTTAVSYMAAVSNLFLKVTAESKTETGTDAVAAGEALSGHVVYFTKTYADVRSIIVTAKFQADNVPFAVYDFVDVPNPTSFTVYLYATKSHGGITAGDRMTGTFSYVVEGI